MAKRQTLCGFFERHDHLIAAFIKEMQVIPLYAVNLIPYGVQYGMCYFAANQWRALVQQHGAVFCLQQLRAGGSEALVGALVDFLTTSIIKSQTNVGIALALKTSACLRHHCVERARTAKGVEPMQAGVRALANCQFNANGGQFSHEIGIQERRGRDAMPEIADGCELRIVTGKNHLSTSQRNLGNHVKQGNLAHKAFVKAQRALEVPLLLQVLEPAQSDPCIELRSCHVGSRANDGVVDQLKDSLEQALQLLSSSAPNALLGLVTFGTTVILADEDTDEENTYTIVGPVSYTHLRAHETPEHGLWRVML